MTPAPISVERLRELLAKATPGPWIAWENSFSRWQILGGRGVLAGIATPNDPASPPDSWGECEVNAALIAEAITVLPALLHQLAEAERAKEEFRLLASLRLFHAPTIGYCWFERCGVSWTGKAHATINEANAEKTAAFLAASGGSK